MLLAERHFRGNLLAVVDGRIDQTGHSEDAADDSADTLREHGFEPRSGKDKAT